MTGNRAGVIKATVVGRVRRLATEKQWRNAIKNGDLKPDSLVEYEVPGQAAQSLAAKDIAALTPIFSEYIPGFDSNEGPVESGQPTPVAAPASSEGTSSGPRASGAVPAREPVERASEGADKSNSKTNSPPERKVTPRAEPNAPEEDTSSPEPTPPPAFPRIVFIVVGAVAALFILLLVFTLSLTDENEPIEEVEAPVFTEAPEFETTEPEPVEIVEAEPSPLPSPSARPSRSPTPTPTPTATPSPTVAPPIAPPIASRARAVAPRNRSRWVPDYPTRAQRRGEEGTVEVLAVVGVNGRVESCDVISSSGYSSLDRAACTMMRRRARFDPALNDAGDPIVSQWTETIHFRLQ